MSPARHHRCAVFRAGHRRGTSTGSSARRCQGIKAAGIVFVGFHVLSVLLLDVWFPENVILIFCLLTGSWFHGAVGYFDAWRSRQKGVR